MTNMYNVVKVAVMRAAQRGESTDGYVLVGTNNNGIEATLPGYFRTKDDAIEEAGYMHDMPCEDWTGEDEDGWLPGEGEGDD